MLVLRFVLILYIIWTYRKWLLFVVLDKTEIIIWVKKYFSSSLQKIWEIIFLKSYFATVHVEHRLWRSSLSGKIWVARWPYQHLGLDSSCSTVQPSVHTLFWFCHLSWAISYTSTSAWTVHVQQCSQVAVSVPSIPRWSSTQDNTGNNYSLLTYLTLLIIRIKRSL